MIKSGLCTFITFCAICAVFSCTVREQLIPQDRLFDGKERKLYRTMTYDRYGRPKFAGILDSLPAKAGVDYYIVDYYSGTGRLIRSFQLTIVPFDELLYGPERPLEMIYTWTGKGFVGGVKAVKYTSQIFKGMNTAQVHDARGALVFGAVVVSVIVIPPIIGTVGGFTTGVVKSALTETERPFLKFREVFSGYVKYYYDTRGRITEMVQYTPAKKPQKLFSTRYRYRGKEMIPEKTVVEGHSINKSLVVDYNEK